MVWAGDRNYFTSGETAYPEDHTVLETKEALAYNRCDESCWHSGGKLFCPQTEKLTFQECQSA